MITSPSLPRHKQGGMRMAEKSDVEVLDRKTPEGKWAAKPLSLAGTARLIEFLGGALENAAERTKIELALKGEGEDAFANPILVLFKVLDEDRLAGLLSIVTLQTPTWIKKNWRLADATRALRDFVENEDIGDVLGNLGESRDLLAGALTEGGTGSQASLIGSSASTEEPQTTG